ncbi:MAG: hypothetical protein FJ023_02300 [Chloroflexi bacterium]|nr:hypothetical protein [Chloroflexota bacterium]
MADMINGRPIEGRISIQAESFFTQSTDILNDNAKLKQVKVVAYTETCTLTGHTYCMNHQRLLDALNQGFIPNSLPIGKDFVPLTKVEVSFPNREREFMSSIYVRKANILFVCEDNGHQPKMSEINDIPKIYPVKAKTPIEAEIRMKLYTLTGQIYTQAWQKLLDAVERADNFLPLTNVEIYPALANTALTFDFVAVNRDKIIYVAESLRLTKAPSPAMELTTSIPG